MGQVQLSNARGHAVALDTLGAAIVSIRVPQEVTVPAGGSAGKTIGRFANRIKRGRFDLDGSTYQLQVNENGNTLHGGPDGFSKREWTHASSGASHARFELVSIDGDQGFPGTLNCSVEYAWSDADELRIAYRAQTDKPTVVNFTNHVYFNFGGENDAEYCLETPASRYVVVDAELIPTGEIAPVESTRYDFRSPRALGAEPIDCCLVLDGWDGELRFAGRLSDPHSGRSIEVHSTQPGFQLYTGKPGAVAMELQHFADAPNHPQFPSTVLRPGQTFTAVTSYRFA